ncbi:MAG: hypothetical protein JSU90_13295 [Nitrospiraceae bacterium]|nr:MAG: hypothetical protein JSU90_13295 [Nitrospiraceae bacterium]
MTIRETIAIISISSLWKALTVKEGIEAAYHTLYIAPVQSGDDDATAFVGEVYGG